MKEDTEEPLKMFKSFVGPVDFYEVTQDVYDFIHKNDSIIDAASIDGGGSNHLVANSVFMKVLEKGANLTTNLCQDDNE